MPNQPKSDKTAADLLTEVGRALFDNAEDWQSRLAAILEVRRDSVRKWLHGTIHFGPDHGALDRLLGIVSRRKDELTRAEADLRSWLELNRPQSPAEDRTEKGSENRGPRPLKS